MAEDEIKIRRWLYPFSFLYGMGVRMRNMAFSWGILNSKTFDIPLISVGNITAGGTGKTPHIEYLIRLLEKEYKVGVLSRGYKRKSTGFLMVEKETPAKKAGDEPYQIKQKFPEVYMAVDKKRSRGVEEMSKEEIAPGLNIVLLDDAFQHRYVQPGLNILLINYNRLISKDKLLPAGRLREPVKGKRRAHIVIVTKCPPNIKPMEYRVLANEIDLYSFQHLYFTSFAYGELTPVFKDLDVPVRPLDSLSDEDHVVLLTGIANPRQLKDEISTHTKNITEMSFSDHHFFSKKDINKLKKNFDALQGENKLIITTEKDAARLTELPFLDETLKRHLYCVPIEVQFLQNQQDNFNQHILGYVRKNRRNSILFKGKDDNKS